MPQQIIKKTTNSFLDKFKGKTSKVPKHGINKILNTNQKINSIINNNQENKYNNNNNNQYNKYNNKNKNNNNDNNSINSDNQYQQQVQPPKIFKLNSKSNNDNKNNKQISSYNSLQVSRMQIFKSKDKAQQRLLADMNQLFGQNNNNPQNTLRNRMSNHIVGNQNNINGKKLNPILNSSLNKNTNNYNHSNGLYNSHEVVSDIQLDKKNMYQLPPLNKNDKKIIILPSLNQNRNHKSFSVASQVSSKPQSSYAADSQFQSINSEKKNKYVFGKYLKLDDQAAKHLEFLKNIQKKSIFKIKQKNQEKFTR